MTKTILLATSAVLFGGALAACNPRTPVHEATAIPPAPAKNAATAPPSPARAPAALPAPVTPSQAPDAISDSVITARTKAGILSDPGMTGADVSVNTDRGVVSLTGTIKSQEQAAIASAHAQRQDGVMRVNTALSVNPQ